MSFIWKQAKTTSTAAVASTMWKKTRIWLHPRCVRFFRNVLLCFATPIFCLSPFFLSSASSSVFVGSILQFYYYLQCRTLSFASRCRPVCVQSQFRSVYCSVVNSQQTSGHRMRRMMYFSVSSALSRGCVYAWASDKSWIKFSECAFAPNLPWFRPTRIRWTTATKEKKIFSENWLNERNKNNNKNWQKMLAFIAEYRAHKFWTWNSE